MSGGKGFGFAGFAMPKRNPSNVSLHAVPPPTTPMHAVPPPSGLSKQGYSTMNAITQNAVTGNWGTIGKKRAKTEDEYFDEDDEPPTPALAYIPAPGSPTNEASSSKADDDDEDPLEAYMAGLEQQAAKDLKTSKENAVTGKGDGARGTRGDIDEMDDEESYYKYMEENPLTTADDGSDVEIEYDQDGNPIPPPKKKIIDPLPPIDHSEIQYEPFEKNFYTPHEDIEKLDHQQVEELKKNLGVKISGPDPPKPVSSFAHLGFDEQLMKAIRRSEYTQPTPVQAAGVPAALSGRDLIGIARTGSGKTAAFLWPLLVHIMDQRELAPGDGPIGLILAPTRELAQQIYMEAKRFGKVYNIRCVCCYGGGSKWEQSKALEGGAEIIVGTPGRVIDLIKCKATDLKRVTYLVLDEADRMFDMGFEPQVRSICNHVRPDRQALLFSATFPRRVEKLARDALHDPVRVQHGAAGEACHLVSQHVRIFNKPEEKWPWLLENLVDFLSSGSVLIFVTKKLEAEQTAANLGVQQYDALLLHGDMDQADRNKVITAFKRQESNILVATDVAARGLDIPHIRTVINYTVARDIDTHTHRVGRTGRAGVRGNAYTLLSRDKDKDFAGHLLRNLEGVQQVRYRHTTCYTVARDIDTHTHRVGRTGRAGVRGNAYTLLSRDKDKDFAGHLLRNLEGVQQVRYRHTTCYTVARDIDTHTHRVCRTGRAGVRGNAYTLLSRDKDKDFAGHLLRNLEGVQQVRYRHTTCYTVARDIDTHTHRVGRTGRAGVRGNAYTLLSRDKDKDFAGHLLRNLEGVQQVRYRHTTCYTVARDIDTHTHRVCRTGRAGVRGNAYTLLSRDKDRDFAGHLLRNLEGVQQEVPEELASLAMQSAWFRKSRFKKGKGKNLNIGGCGLGYKERPGLPSYNDEAPLAIAPEKTGGPATDRLASLKQAFRSQYNQFTASSDHSWEQTRAALAPGVIEPAEGAAEGAEDGAERPERVRKSGKRSRWE